MYKRGENLDLYIFSITKKKMKTNWFQDLKKKLDNL